MKLSENFENNKYHQIKISMNQIKSDLNNILLGLPSLKGKIESDIAFSINYYLLLYFNKILFYIKILIFLNTYFKIK